MKNLKKMPVTYTIIILCVINFLIINFWSKNITTTCMAIVCGAYYKAFVSAGEVWRLLTVGLVHIDVFHLAINMFSLYTLGSLLERYYGSLRYGIILAICTISGSLTSYIFDGNTVLVGISGGLYGLMATEIMMIIKSGALQNKGIRSSLISTILINIMINFIPGIGVYAHLGGFLMGILLSFSFKVYAIDKKLQRKYAICTILLLVLLIGFSFTKREIKEDEMYLGTDIEVLQYEKDHGLGWYANNLCDRLESLYDIYGIQFYLN